MYITTLTYSQINHSKKNQGEVYETITTKKAICKKRTLNETLTQIKKKHY